MYELQRKVRQSIQIGTGFLVGMTANHAGSTVLAKEGEADNTDTADRGWVLGGHDCLCVLTDKGETSK